MSTPSDSIAGLREMADGILGEGRFQNFVAQSHSRDVLRQMQIPEADWPAYTPALDEDLVYGAQTLLYVGLRLKVQAETPDAGDIYLTRGAEVLEYVYARSDAGDPERVCQLFTAALTYYMAGHFAQAFVLVRDLEAEAPLPRFLRPLRLLLLKQYRPLRVEVLDRLHQGEYEDAVIAAGVAAGELDEDAALCRILEATLYRALSHFLEHARTGAPGLLSTAETLLDVGTDVATAHRFADWWWYFSCVRVMLATFRRHSLWTNLGPFLDRPETADVARRYVRANLRLPTPVTELWPSQVTAVPHLFEPGRRNLCIRMPTSAGKTKIAELAILSHLTSGVVDPDFKCVYVAPFRSLAVEVEQTLRPALRPLGLRVSELYGGFEFTATDRLIIESTHVLVATPEKFDAFLRFSPDLAGQIRLVILDEGHIISPPNLRALRQARGLKYEVFLQRLVARCQKSAARIVFLSAVMPNAEQFAEWITGERDGLVSSDWRPSRLMLGEAVWDGTKVDIEFTHADRLPLGHRCFVRGFVPARPAVAVPGRKHPFPHDDAEAIGLTALELARHKLTMVFVAQKRSTVTFGRTLLKCIRLRRKVASAAGEAYGLPVAPEHQAETDRCIALVREHMGEESEYIVFLREGFVIHHSSLPQPIRLAVERLVRSGAVRLVVATTTLAQGVNFPIHTVLVHSLHQGQDQPVTPMDFWNIYGRAGRGMKENEGQVLFFVKQCFEEWNENKSKSAKFKRQPRPWRVKKWQEWCDEQRQFRASYLAQYGTYQVQSGLLHLLNQVNDLWIEKHGTIDLPRLCEALANHTLDMFAPSEAVDLESLLSTLDGLLIAMTEECVADDITPDTFQDLLCRSLVHLQLATPQERTAVNEAFASRVRYIRGRYPDRAKRLQFYRLGLPLRDCEFIEEHRAELLRLYLQASAYADWPIEQRAGHISDIAGYLFQLSEIAPDDVPDSHRRILELWMAGSTHSQMLADPAVSGEGLTLEKLNKWTDEVFSFRLPWGLNSVGCYLRQSAEASGEQWPEVCDYYSAFVKYGVNETVVCWLLAAGVAPRSAAARIGRFIGDRFGAPEAMARWLRSVGTDELIRLGLGPSDATLLRELFPTAGGAGGDESRSVTIRIRRPREVRTDLSAGTPLLIEPVVTPDARRYRLLTLSGEVVREFDMDSESLAVIMSAPEFVTATIADQQVGDSPDTFRVRIEVL